MNELTFEKWLEANQGASLEDAFNAGAAYSHSRYVKVGTYHSGSKNAIFPSGYFMWNKEFPKLLMQAGYEAAPAYIMI